jgi:DNA (cytosine-5)-methyltransferase 1
MMAHVDLCSGIGGFALGFEWAELSKPVLFCDIEPWSRQILAKHWPDVPIADDVKELANDPTRIIHAIGDRPSILTAGYPCQPFSQAGQRRGSEDDRHIWPEIFSIVQQVRPDWIVCENVSGHITMGLNEVLSDLADKANYAVQTFHLGAVSVDAPHRRMRLWIVARNVDDTKSNRNKGRLSQIPRTNERAPKPKKQYENAAKQFDDAGKHTSILADTDRLNRRAVQEPQGRRKENPIKRQSPSNSSSDVADAQSVRTGKSRHAHKTEGSTESSATQPNGSSADVADAQSKRLEDDGRCGELGRERDRRRVPTQSGGEKRSNTWKPRSEICRMVDGIPYWVDEPRDIPRVSQGVPNRVQRLKGLGNAILPQIAMRIGQTIKAVQDA